MALDIHISHILSNKHEKKGEKNIFLATFCVSREKRRFPAKLVTAPASQTISHTGGDKAFVVKVDASLQFNLNLEMLNDELNAPHQSGVLARKLL